MRTIVFGARSEEGRCYVERGNGDGGSVACYMVQEADGTWTARRDWYSDGLEAQAAFDTVTPEIMEERIATKRER